MNEPLETVTSSAFDPFLPRMELKPVEEANQAKTTVQGIQKTRVEASPQNLEAGVESTGNVGGEFVEFLQEERKALERSFDDIIEAMRSGGDWDQRLSSWAKDFKRSSAQFQQHYQAVQQSQKLLKGSLTIAQDPTMQFTSAGVTSAEYLSLSLEKSLADFDFLTGISLEYEGKENTPIKAEISKITGRYDDIRNYLKGAVAIGSTATWFAKNRVVKSAEATLEMLRGEVRDLESGNTGNLTIWLQSVVKECEGQPEMLGELLKIKGVDLAQLQKLNDGKEVKAEELLSNSQLKKEVIGQVLHTLKTEIIKLETFVCVEQELLQQEAVTLFVNVSRFGTEVAGFIMSGHGLAGYLPDFISSALLLSGASIKLHEDRKALERLGDYGKEMHRGAFQLRLPAVDEKVTVKDFTAIRDHQMSLYKRKAAIQQYNRMIAIVMPQGSARRGRVKLADIKKQLLDYGVNVDLLKGVSTFADFKKPEVRQQVIEQLIKKQKDVTPVEAHLQKMKEADRKIREKAGEQFDLFYERINNPEGIINIESIVGQFEAFFGPLNIEGKVTRSKFVAKIMNRKEEFVEKAVQHQQTMNVSTRNFLRTLSTEKVNSEKTLSKWAVGTSSIGVAVGVVSVLSSVVTTITLIGLVSLGVAATWLSLGSTLLLFAGMGVGLAVLYYYKPRVFKSIFTIQAIRANYAKFRMARRTFDTIQADHQKKVAAVTALNEKVNVHLSGIDTLIRFYLGNDQTLKIMAEGKLKRLGLIQGGRLDDQKWKNVKRDIQGAQYNKIRQLIGKVKVGHVLELGSFGIYRRYEDIGSKLDEILNPKKYRGLESQQLRDKALEEVERVFIKAGFTLADQDKVVFRAILTAVENSNDLNSPETKSKLLVVLGAMYLEKEIQKQKNAAGKLFDSYSTLGKYSKEFANRQQLNTFDDTMNRVVFGSAHSSIERKASKEYKQIKANLVEKFKKNKQQELSDVALEGMGINVAWLKKDLALQGVTVEVFTPENLLQFEVRRLIMSQCRDRVSIEAKEAEAFEAIEKVIAGKKDDEIVDSSMEEALYARGIEFRKALIALGYENVTVGDLRKPPLVEELQRRFRANWYELFRDAPAQIGKSVQDPLTAEFLTREFGIESSALTAGVSLQQIQKYMAMGGAEMDAFLRKRRAMARIAPVS